MLLTDSRSPCVDFQYDGDQLLVRYQEQGASGTPMPWYYIWGPTGPIMELSGTTTNPEIDTFMFDPNGSIVDRAAGQSQLIDNPHMYDAYGEPIWLPPAGDTSQDLVFRYKGRLATTPATTTAPT